MLTQTDYVHTYMTYFKIHKNKAENYQQHPLTQTLILKSN